MLAKMYARAGKTRDLAALVREPNDVVLDDIEPVLIETGQFAALCGLLERRGDTERLLEAWSK